MKILVASHNGHKINEIKEYLSHLEVEILSLSDLNFNNEIEEDQDSFLGNAIKKAKTIQMAYPEMMILSDDSGFGVKHLNNQPGVFSSRFLGEEVSDELKNREILRRLEGVADRKAIFTCAMVLLTPTDQFITQQVVYGTVSTEPMGEGGFGYDPIFIPEHSELTFAQDLDYKAKVSHRAKALEEVVKYVKYLVE